MSTGGNAAWSCARLAAGEIHAVDDLITWNLDIRQFAQDAIDRCEGPELLRALYKAIRDVTVLDPTCGSGAFLFAALNVLFPLHDACLERMRGFLDDLAREPAHRPEKYRDFREAIDLVAQHPSQDYHVLRQIVLNNLYGVDIMPEAVEICKLRLFLKLVAQLDRPEQIEPLPDIDFNIRAGNTLVGFATHEQVRAAIRGEGKLQSRMDLFDEMAPIDERADLADRAFKHFKDEQNKPDHDKGDLHSAKQDYQKRLGALRGELDRALAMQYGINTDRADSFKRWQETYRPFHWFVEFYSIMRRYGGFSAVVGNPPYVELTNVRDYSPRGFATESTGNLYALVLERSRDLIHPSGAFGMIIPMSGHSTQRMSALVERVYRRMQRIWMMNLSGDANPSRLFEGVKFRLAIVVAKKRTSIPEPIWTTEYMKWFAEERTTLFDRTRYCLTETEILGAIPKIGDKLHKSVIMRMTRDDLPILGKYLLGDQETYFHNAPVSWIRAHSFIPFFRSERDGERRSSQLRPLNAKDQNWAYAITAVLSSSAFFIWWITISDSYHLNAREINYFPVDLDNEGVRGNLARLGAELEDDLRRNAQMRTYRYRTSGEVVYEEFYPKLSKSLIDKIDRELAYLYQFDPYELDYVMNYMWKYRHGRSAAD